MLQAGEAPGRHGKIVEDCVLGAQSEVSNFHKAAAAFRPLGLDNRALNALVRGGVCSMDQLSALTEAQASRISGLGPKTLRQLRPYLKHEEATGDPEDRTLSIKFDASTIADIDVWIDSQVAIGSRPLAVRHLVSEALKIVLKPEPA